MHNKPERVLSDLNGEGYRLLQVYVGIMLTAMRAVRRHWFRLHLLILSAYLSTYMYCYEL